MRGLYQQLSALLRTGQIAVGTPAGPAPLLLTQISIDGDVIMRVDTRFLAAPDSALLASHWQAVRHALAPLGRLRQRMEGAANLVAGIAGLLPPGLPVGIGLWRHAFTGLWQLEWQPLAWAAASASGAAAGVVLFGWVRGAAIRWIARRVRREFSTLAQGDTAPAERGAG